jgi:hypothetical protein
MPLRDRRWYPAAGGLLLLGFWLLLAAVFDRPTWPEALLGGSLAAVLTAWTENLRRERRLRGQLEENMGTDYRA